MTIKGMMASPDADVSPTPLSDQALEPVKPQPQLQMDPATDSRLGLPPTAQVPPQGAGAEGLRPVVPVDQPIANAQVQVTVVRAARPAIVLLPVVGTAQPGGTPSDQASDDLDGGAAEPGSVRTTATAPAAAIQLAAINAARALADLAEASGLMPDAATLASDQGDQNTSGLPGLAGAAQTTGQAALAPLAAPGPVIATLAAAIPANITADQVEVILSPEELGRVRMDFRADGEVMRVFLTAERPETLDLLRRHADQLASELCQAGYSGASLSFGQWGQPQGEARPRAQAAANPHAQSHTAPAAATYSARGQPGQGLDLRI